MIEIARNKWSSTVENTTELKDSLATLLPPCNYDVRNMKGSSEQFVADIDLDLTTEEDARGFVRTYSSNTKEVLKIAKNYLTTIPPHP